ncbi:type VI secretion system baseplate subunit TssF [Pseudoduganella eburnea]|uniref:Type VI secretion system baseplate subunit TssF n=1 Tax=Massilia eburnea TaxID=1776165 RepID=A0A6L6QP53_9BURK|nr:type VI secretion system baseplate subunit TssF [Massilia eburnea]MTW13874.1 type VI secretion system baseplate subunit TssF [Massilia eburnea]
MEKLLHHYEQELVRLREATRRYAEKHPNTASALELGPDASTDPEVERLLQSVALLNAATQKMIEEGRGEFHKALLQTLQPHYLRVVPACAIAHVDTSSARPNEINAVSRLPLGAILCAGANKFTTAYEACIAPIAIADVKFQLTIDLPASLSLPGDATSALIIGLHCTANSASFNQPPVRNLRIHIAGEPGLRGALLDAILMHGRCVCLEADGAWHALAKPPFAAVGEGDAEALLPSQAGPQSPRLLTEYFHFPQKFDFIDLDLEGISAVCAPGCKQISLHIVLPSCNPRLRAACIESLRLGCTPAINIFPLPAAPIRLDGRSGAYPLHPKLTGCEIYSVEKVALVKASGEQIIPPFHGKEHSIAGPYWQLDEQEGIALKFIDREQRPFNLQSGTIAAHLTCTNSHPLHRSAKLATEANTVCFPIQFLGEITAPGFSPEYGQLAQSLYTEDTTLPDLCRQLRLHGCKFAESLKGLVAKPTTAWLEHAMGRVHMYGTEFTVLVDEPALQEQSIYIFAEMLTVALADKLRENRFAQLRIANANGQVLHCAKPRVGTRPLL